MRCIIGFLFIVVSLMAKELPGQKAQYFPGSEFWSAFDGPPLGSGGTLYNENGIVLTFQIKKSANTFGESTRPCNLPTPNNQSERQAKAYGAMDYYYVQFKLTNNHPYLDFKSKSAPSFSMQMGEIGAQVHPGLCDNCACSSHEDVGAQVNLLAAGESITFDDVSNGLWAFSMKDCYLHKWRMGQYEMVVNPNSGVAQSGQRYNSLVQAGDKAMANGDFNQAIAFYQQALNEEGDHEAVRKKIAEAQRRKEQHAEALIKKGQAAIDREDYTEAIAYLGEALDLSPEMNEALQQIREVKKQLELMAAAQHRSPSEIFPAEEDDSWSGFENELEGQLSSDFESMEQADINENVFEEQSRNQAGELVPGNNTAGNNTSSTSSNGGRAQNNYSTSECRSITNALRSIYREINQLEENMFNAMHRNDISGVERYSQSIGEKTDRLLAVSKRIGQARQQDKLSPDCIDEISDIQNDHANKSGNRAEKEMRRMQSKLRNMR